MNLLSKQFIPLLKASLLLIVMGFSFLWGQKKYTTSQDLTIPSNLTKLTVKAWGAGGGGGTGATGGAGGFTQASVPVTPGDVYRIVVGEAGGYRNFRELGTAPHFYSKGDSIWPGTTAWFYGAGGCSDTDDVGCGSFGGSNIWPQVTSTWYNEGETKRYPLDANGNQYPIGTPISRPGDSNWAETGRHSPGSENGSGGQMSGLYKKDGPNPEVNIINYILISGGGGGGGGTWSNKRGGAGGGGVGQDAEGPSTGGAGGVGGITSNGSNYSGFAGQSFSSGGAGGFQLTRTGPDYRSMDQVASGDLTADGDVIYDMVYNKSGRTYTDGAGGGGGYGGGGGGEEYWTFSGGSGGGGYVITSANNAINTTGVWDATPNTGDLDYIGTYGQGGAKNGHGNPGFVVIYLGDKPVGNSISVSTLDNVPINTDIIATDTESNTSDLTYEVSTPPSNGTVTGTAPNYIYTPNVTHTGSDLFKVTVIDEHENRSDPVSVTVTTVARAALSDITYSSPGPYTGAALIGQQITITATFDEEILAVPFTQITSSGEQSNFPANMTR